MATILHLDTSGPFGIAMLAKDGQPVATRRSEGEREHAGHINHIVDEVLREAKIRFEHIDAIAVCNGPGSYTGLRIGLSTAKGYCYILGKPLLLHNRLSLMLREASLRGEDRNRIAVLPARTGEYYAAVNGSAVLQPTHLSTSELMGIIDSNLRPLIIGRVSDDLLSVISSEGTDFVEHHMLDESSWAGAGDRSFFNGEWADMAYAEPEYLKSVFIATKRS